MINSGWELPAGRAAGMGAQEGSVASARAATGADGSRQVMER